LNGVLDILACAPGSSEVWRDHHVPARSPAKITLLDKVRSLMRKAAMKPVWNRKFVHTTNTNMTADRCQCAELTLQSRRVESGLRQRYHVHSHRRRMVVLGCRARPESGQGDRLGHGAEHARPAGLRALQHGHSTAAAGTGADRPFQPSSQDASALYQHLLTAYGFVCSMSRERNCWDNAVAERFFLNLKMERVWQRQYANHAQARAAIADYIVGFYNCKRINSALRNLSPAVDEREMAAREPIVVSEIT
jgi:putative transposase